MTQLTFLDSEDFIQTIEEARLYISDKISIDRQIERLYKEILDDPKK
jgi:hypothetical protein